MDVAESESAPAHVVLAADGSDDYDRFASVLSSVESVTTESVDDLAGIEGRLGGSDPVGCVVCAGSLGEVRGVELVRAVKTCEPTVSVVYSPQTANGVEASEAVAAGATEYVPAELGEGALREGVERAVDEGDRRRRRHRRSAMLRTLYESLPISMYFKDTEARYVWATAELEAGIDESPIGKTDLEVWSDWDSVEEAYEDDLRVLRTGDPIVDKEEYHLTERGEVWMKTTKLPWYGPAGEPRGLVGISRNVTEEKERERELQLQARRFEQFARFVSHDLRNPVSLASGYLEMARETGDEAALDEVESALSRMDTLIEDLLQMVRGTDEERRTDEIDLEAIARSVWESVDAPEATLRVSIPTGTSIRGVEGALRRLFDNLFRNAVDHAGSDVSVAVGLTAAGFFVEDDGPGVDLADPNAILEDGYSQHGTGIGLTIVEDIADSHGWEVSVTESDTGGLRLEFDGCVLLKPSLTNLREATAHDLASETTIGQAPTGRVERDADGRVTVTGYGRDVFYETDEHHFAYADLEGDVRVEARLVDLEPTDEYSKAGVMVRSAPTAGSSLGYVGMTPAHGTEAIWRSSQDDQIEPDEFDDVGRLPRWYRLDLVGQTATVYTSETGDDWTAIDQRRLATDGSVAAGLAVCSHHADRPCSAVFEDVRVVELVPDGD